MVDKEICTSPCPGPTHSKVVLEPRRFFLSSHSSPQANVVTSLGVKAAQSRSRRGFLCTLKCLRSLKVLSFLKTDTLGLLLEELETGILFQSCLRCLMAVSENAAAYAGLVPAVDSSSPEPPAFVSAGFGTLQVLFWGDLCTRLPCLETQESVLFKIFFFPLLWVGI